MMKKACANAESLKRTQVIVLLLFLVLSEVIASDDGSRYTEVDRHALNAPSSVTKSVVALSQYLTKPFTTDEEKVRAIFRWIADNITYDVEGYFSGRRSSSEPEDVLQSRSSVCAGYSSLFEALGRTAGLEVVTIDGYAKGIGYHPGDIIPSESNHAWNAVKILGEWKLIDCTWGAGRVDDNYNYKKEFEPYFFFTKPEEFVYRHLPTDKRWQLLRTPISRQEFQNLPFVSPAFFQCELRLPNDQRVILELQNEITLKLSTPFDVYCNATLEQHGKTLDAAVLIQRSGSAVRIRIMPPSPGDYYLSIFAKRGSSEGLFPHAVGFKVAVSTTAEKSASFPLMFGTFIEKNVQLQSPQNRDLPSGSMQIFSLIAPGAEKVAVVCGEERDFLKKTGNQFEGTVEIDMGKVAVYAQYPERKDFQELLEYTGTGSTKRVPAPIKFERYMNSGAELVSPLKKELPTGKTQTFRIKLPGARKAAVVIGEDWQFLTKEGEYFEGEINIRAGKITLLATYLSTSYFEGLLEYEGKK